MRYCINCKLTTYRKQITIEWLSLRASLLLVMTSKLTKYELKNVYLLFAKLWNMGNRLVWASIYSITISIDFELVLWALFYYLSRSYENQSLNQLKNLVHCFCVCSFKCSTTPRCLCNIIANIDKKSTVVNHKDLNLMVHMTDFLMTFFY